MPLNCRFFCQFARDVVLNQCVDHVLNVAIHERDHVVRVESDAMVGDATLGEIVGSDFLAPVARTDLALSQSTALRIRFFLLKLVNLGSENRHCFQLVLRLASFVLACDDDASWLVDNADCSFVLLHVLTTCGTGTEGRNFEVVVFDFYVDFFCFRHDRYGDR